MGTIISIFSGKGGVGQTSLAVNIAVAMTRRHADEVVLLDLKSSDRTDIPSFLDAPAPPALSELTPSPGPQTARILQRKTAWYQEGIDLLCLSRPEEGPPSRFQLTRWMNCLAEAYGWIVIDASQVEGEVTETVLVNSHRVLIPVTPDPLSLDQFRKDVRVLVDLGQPKEHILPVLNRSQTALDAVEVERCLRRKPFGIVPEDKDTFQSCVLNRKSVFQADSLASQRAFLELAEAVRTEAPPSSSNAPLVPQDESPSKETLATMKRHLKRRLLEEIDLKGMELPSKASSDKRDLERDVRSFLMDIIDEEDPNGQLSAQSRLALQREVLDECLGYGVIQPLVDDPSVTEIMVNGTGPIFLERNGVLLETQRHFEEEEELLGVIERILAPLGRRVDEKSPMADGRLPDGSRVNAVIRPLAVDGPTLTIRKFSKAVMGPEDLEREGSLDAAMLDLMARAVRGRISLLISGGTGSGKTTLLNALSSFIPQHERIITIEDAAELVLQQPHVVRLESRPPGIDGNNAVTIRQLVVNALRMRPTRIIVGECRSGEALDMLQAMNTGHAGSMTTLHANSPMDALRRLETLVLMAGDELPLQAIREHIASAIGLIIHLERFSDGSRKVASVAELAGINGQCYMLKELFSFRRSEDNGEVVRGAFEAPESEVVLTRTKETSKEISS